MTKRQQVMAAACGIEAATGLGLLVAPAVVARLVLGADIAGISVIVGNIAGLALIALAIACWPRLTAGSDRGTYLAMLVYNLLVALLLAETGVSGTANGALLWPVVVLHSIFSFLIALAWIGSRRGAAQQ